MQQNSVSCRPLYLELLKKKCVARNIPWGILDAIITTESAWNPWAVRYEEHFIHTLSPERFSKYSKITTQTELQLQKCSWGLGQIMGASARDLGYIGNLTELCKPEANLEWVCLFYATRCMPYKDVKEQVAAYNAGSPRYIAAGTFINQEYVDKVLLEFKKSSKEAS